MGNVYFSNDHTEAMSFSDNFYTKLLEFQYLFPEAYTIILGDFNCCMEKNDSVNRIGTQQELDLVKTLKAKNKTCDLVDTYRILGVAISNSTNTNSKLSETQIFLNWTIF